MISENRACEDGPAIVDETAGQIRIYTIKSDWRRFKRTVHRELRAFPDVDELSGHMGCLYPLSGSDWRYCWAGGTTIALCRDFRGNPQRIASPLGGCYDLEGKRAQGWITCVVFLGEIRDKAQFRRR